ncbi:DUF3540 domain-containing protein [Enhygromyxa salina]|nr:DUF3540 domain-containing protein [Enhygromyxa salina]
MHAHDLSRQPQTPTAELVDGPATVISRAGAHLQLARDDQEFVALRASSCLLEPAPGDRVWCVGLGAERYVIAVLVRAVDEGTTLSVDGDLHLVAGGRVSLAAVEGIVLATPAKLEVDADELRVKASRARVLFEDVSAFARTLVASFMHATRLGTTLEMFVDNITQRSKQVQRCVEGVEMSEAGTLIQRTHGTAHIQAKQALINGTQLTKIDGQQVQLG